METERELPMAVLDHHAHRPVDTTGQGRRVIMFLLTWVAFFAGVYVLALLISAL